MMEWAQQDDPFRLDRETMVRWQLQERGISDERVLDAMRRVPRHGFVDPAYRSQAYEDHPIPIGLNQTISQPYMVAIMLQLLSLQPHHVALEIGTGSGYTAALLGELVAQVYSVERHPALSEKAKRALQTLGCRNVTCIAGDGTLGLPEFAPFDDILVWAAARQVPHALIDQLREGGRMVIPVGPQGEQELQVLTRREGKIEVKLCEGCRFVPLISGLEGEGPWF